MKIKIAILVIVGISLKIEAQENNFNSDLFLKYNYAKISLGKQGADGDVHFGAMGNGTPQNGLQDYGFYAAHNAYRGDDGKWYHSRSNTIPGLVYSGSAGVSSGLNGFHWRYTTNVGTAAINWTSLMSLDTSGNLNVTGNITGSVFRSNTNNTKSHYFIRNGGGAAVYMNQVDNVQPILKLSSGTNTPNQKVKLTVENDGSIGLGDIDNDNWSKISHIKSDDYGFDFQHNNATIITNEQGGVNQAIVIGDVSENHSAPLFGVSIKDKGAWIPRFIVGGNGNVGIGTNTTGSHKLAVEGSIGAREIKVEGSGWSDFVFEKSYKLPTLEKVEKHIKEKGHLKDIPSAKEVEKNGFFLGEMDAKLLQKIEELTLYTIQQEKKLKKQNSKINKQQKELEELKTLVKNLLKTKKLN